MGQATEAVTMALTDRRKPHSRRPAPMRPATNSQLPTGTKNVPIHRYRGIDPPAASCMGCLPRERRMRSQRHGVRRSNRKHVSGTSPAIPDGVVPVISPPIRR